MVCSSKLLEDLLRKCGLRECGLIGFVGVLGVAVDASMQCQLLSKMLEDFVALYIDDQDIFFVCLLAALFFTSPKFSKRCLALGVQESRFETHQ